VSRSSPNLRSLTGVATAAASLPKTLTSPPTDGITDAAVTRRIRTNLISSAPFLSPCARWWATHSWTSSPVPLAWARPPLLPGHQPPRTSPPPSLLTAWTPSPCKFLTPAALSQWLLPRSWKQHEFVVSSSL
jgi:hypothetical protein